MSHAGGGSIVSKARTYWNADISPDIKEYFQKKGMSSGDCLREFYKISKSKELTELLKEKKELLERVTQIDETVTQLEIENITQQQIVTQQKKAEIEQKLRTAHDPYFFVGKEIEGITITKEMVDKIKEAKARG